MAKSKTVFLTSDSAVAANRSTIDECAAKQCLPSWFTSQLGNKVVALPTQNLSATIFAISAREDGGFSLKVSFSGTVVDGLVVTPQKGNYNFKISGWVVVYPEGADVPEGTATVTENELNGILAFGQVKTDSEGKPVLNNGKIVKNRLWYDLSNCARVYLVPVIVDEHHYVLDTQGNKVVVGNENGRPVFDLGTHQVLSFALASINAPLQGDKTGGSNAISTSDKVAADAALNALLGGRSV